MGCKRGKTLALRGVQTEGAEERLCPARCGVEGTRVICCTGLLGLEGHGDMGKGMAIARSGCAGGEEPLCLP